jgi:cytochrome c-type biogenesis protein
MADITIPIAFLTGVISFLSPCILPLTPAFISYLAGSSVVDASGNKVKPSRLKIFLNASFFVTGFVVVFSLLGVLLNSVLSNVAYDARIWLSYVGGTIIIFFGLYLIGVFKIPFLNVQHKLQPKRFKSNYLTSFVFGVAFAAGWTPCIGAVLGGILTLAIVQPAAAFNLMLAYSFGLGIPFLIAGAFISQFSAFITRFSGFMKYFTIAMGVILVALGILVITGYIGAISLFLPTEMLGG